MATFHVATTRQHCKTDKVIPTDLYEITTVDDMVLWCFEFTRIGCTAFAITRPHSCPFQVVGPSEEHCFHQKRCNTRDELWNSFEAAEATILKLSDVFQ
jgi:hypothetical protein